MRLESPAACLSTSASRETGFPDRIRPRVESVAVMDAEFFPMLFGAEECFALEQCAHFARPCLTPAQLRQSDVTFAHVEALVASWGMPVLDEALLRRFPQLRVVFYAAGTIRSIVTEASWRRGIRFTTAALANAKPVAEFTQAAIVFALKHVWQRSHALRTQNLYQRHEPEIPGCYGTTVGLIALGKIGRLVAQRLRDMDVRVIGYDPYVSRAEAERLGVRLCPIEELFATSDVVSCHLPLHAGTAGMIGGALFRSMKPGATFINTARGGVVNEPELVEVLAGRPDLFAVLDTIAEEPPAPGCALLNLPNVIVTPHIAGSMCGECRRMGLMMIGELRRYVAGEPLIGEVCEADLAILA